MQIIMLTEQQQEWIDEIMDNFDFEKVHKTMVALDWTWVVSLEDNLFEIPDKQAIMKEARRIMRQCLETCTEEGTGVGTGGFTAMFHGDGLTLRFVVEDYGAWNDQ